MPCLLNCLRNWLGPILVAAVVGAVIGAIVVLGIVCVPLGGTLGAAGGPAGSVGLTLTCSAVALWPLLGWVLVGALIGATIGAVALVLIALLICGAQCINAASAAGSSNAISQGFLPTGSPLDCSSATTAVDEIQQQLDSAVAARDEQEAIVGNRNSVVVTARNALVASMVALAGTSFWNPFAMIAAGAAVAAASVAVAIAESRYIAEQAKLAELAARVVALQAALQTALEVKESLCGSPGTTEQPSPPGGGDVEIPDIDIGTIGVG